MLLGSALAAQEDGETLLLTGARVLNASGDGYLEGHSVVVSDGRILRIAESKQSAAAAPDARRLDLPGLTLLPGLIDAHSHLLLHPYDETSWDDQVLREQLELRTIRGVVAARATLEAGFTTLRDLGTEGAGFADVALRDAAAQGLIEGPRLFVATRALVASGCYGPAGFDPRWTLPKGAQVADGPTGVRRAVREQIAAGADWIKVYADYRRRRGGPSSPTFSQEEL
ncbi:MAG: amidohydrolase family protein, partial [bacterium]|nr:amidohydrolase family protein [bacterium]